jgi:tRNA(fMet)-specific endonuclease VapC
VKYVLDANAAIAALNDVGSVRARLAAVPASEVGIPIVAVAELLFGACKSSRREENLARIAALKRAVAVLPLSDRVADLYGENRAALESRGIVKSDFDLVIACTALEQDAILVTSDRGLLDNSIPSLRAEDWLE